MILPVFYMSVQLGRSREGGNSDRVFTNIGTALCRQNCDLLNGYISPAISLAVLLVSCRCMGAVTQTHL
jgi:hypothetical protein